MVRSIVLSCTLLAACGLAGCRNKEVPDKDAPGGIMSGSEYQRIRARSVGKDAGALLEPERPVPAAPTTIRALPTSQPFTAPADPTTGP